MSKVAGLESLAQKVPSGATIAIGGFQLNRVPIALVNAIAAGEHTNFKAISAPNPLALEILAAAGCLRSAECGFIGFQYEYGFVIAPAVRHAMATGKLDLRQPDVYHTIRSLRSERDDGKEVADFALLHAQQADRTGNLFIDDPYVDVLLAEASGRVLATAETLVDRIDKPTIPAARVQQIALAKNDSAKPCIIVTNIQLRTMGNDDQSNGIDKPVNKPNRIPRAIPPTTGVKIKHR